MLQFTADDSDNMTDTWMDGPTDLYCWWSQSQLFQNKIHEGLAWLVAGKGVVCLLAASAGPESVTRAMGAA